jgi:hypothetical protein
MKIRVRRDAIVIEPETGYGKDETEVAFIEKVLGLKKDGDWIRLVRKNAMGLSCIAYLETEIAGEDE